MRINQKFITISVIIGIMLVIIISILSTNKERIYNSILFQEAKISNNNLERNYNMSYKENLKKMELLPISKSNTPVNNVNLMSSEQDDFINLETTKSYLTEGSINKVRINIIANFWKKF